jgi:hypothetical protein
VNADVQANADLLDESEKEGLWMQEQANIRAEMAAYAAKVAGTVDDLDPAWEAAGLESLWDTE